ncbi:MAG: hypothetical protein M3441_22550 [Chloroflexota bacterium]|nr:hypothetical protein [Chloroflexota bacterium]
MAGLAVVHLFSGKLRFLEGTPRSIWLSMAGGISVAYVFVHLLPDLAEEQQAIREAVGETFSFLEYHVYLVALVGLATFYGLERAAKISRRRRRTVDKEDSTEAGIFWLHIASFTAYNALIGEMIETRRAREAACTPEVLHDRGRYAGGKRVYLSGPARHLPTVVPSEWGRIPKPVAHARHLARVPPSRGKKAGCARIRRP